MDWFEALASYSFPDRPITTRPSIDVPTTWYPLLHQEPVQLDPPWSSCIFFYDYTSKSLLIWAVQTQGALAKVVFILPHKIPSLRPLTNTIAGSLSFVWHEDHLYMAHQHFKGNKDTCTVVITLDVCQVYTKSYQRFQIVKTPQELNVMAPYSFLFFSKLNYNVEEGTIFLATNAGAKLAFYELVPQDHGKLAMNELMLIEKRHVSTSINEQVTYKCNAVYTTDRGFWLELRNGNRPLWDKLLLVQPRKRKWEVVQLQKRVPVLGCRSGVFRWSSGDKLFRHHSLPHDNPRYSHIRMLNTKLYDENAKPFRRIQPPQPKQIPPVENEPDEFSDNPTPPDAPARVIASHQARRFRWRLVTNIQFASVEDHSPPNKHPVYFADKVHNWYVWHVHNNRIATTQSKLYRIQTRTVGSLRQLSWEACFQPSAQDDTNRRRRKLSLLHLGFPRQAASFCEREDVGSDLEEFSRHQAYFPSVSGVAKDVRARLSEVELPRVADVVRGNPQPWGDQINWDGVASAAMVMGGWLVVLLAVGAYRYYKDRFLG